MARIPQSAVNSNDRYALARRDGRVAASRSTAPRSARLTFKSDWYGRKQLESKSGTLPVKGDTWFPRRPARCSGAPAGTGLHRGPRARQRTSGAGMGGERRGEVVLGWHPLQGSRHATCGHLPLSALRVPRELRRRQRRVTRGSRVRLSRLAIDARAVPTVRTSRARETPAGSRDRWRTTPATRTARAQTD